MAFADCDDQICILQVVGNLDRDVAARLLRLVDTELAVLTRFASHLSGLVIDLSVVDLGARGSLETLRHARYICRRAGIDLCLVAAPQTQAALPARAHLLLSEFQTFLSAANAVTFLTESTPG